MKLSRRALVCVALAAMTPLAILVACGSSTFSADDSDAQTVDPQNDAGGDSQTTASDASTEAAPPTPTWCQTNAPNAFFCADFDEGDFTKGYSSGTLQTVFTTIILLDGGAAGLAVDEGDAGKSPPGSLHAIVPTLSAVAVEETAQAQSAYANAAGASGFQIDFELRNDASGTTSSYGGTVRVEVKDPTDGVTYAVFEIDLTQGGTSFQRNGTLEGLGAYPTFNVWTHYRIILQLGGNVTVQVDDAGVIDEGSSATKISTSNLQLTLGQDCAVSGGPPQCGQEVSFDNVVIHALGLADGG